MADVHEVQEANDKSKFHRQILFILQHVDLYRGKMYIWCWCSVLWHHLMVENFSVHLQK